MDVGFIIDESMKHLKNLSDDDKKWALLFLCYLFAGEEEIKKFVDSIGNGKGGCST